MYCYFSYLCKFDKNEENQVHALIKKQEFLNT